MARAVLLAYIPLIPVSGFIDRTSGFVSLSIDRSSKGLGVEKFEGTLMSPESVPAEDQVIGPCAPDVAGQKAEFMIVANSKQTGRQLVIFLHDVVGLGFHEKPFCPR